MVETKKEEVVSLARSYGFRLPIDIINQKSQQVDICVNDIIKSIERNSMMYKQKIQLLSKSLETYDVQGALKRGFVLVKQNSKFVKRASDFNKERKSLLKFYDGEVTTR